jgi:ribosomal protein S18 acetylase RimI-like enzyme
MVPEDTHPPGASPLLVRPAAEADLPAIYAIWYANEVGGDPNPPPRGSDMLLRHELGSAEFYVAALGDRVAGFAAAVVRDQIVFLSECFVGAAFQSRGVGQALVQRLLAPDGRVRCTLSSRDPRALSLYIRAGLRPRWPHFCLFADTARLADLPAGTAEVAVVGESAPDLVEWDAAIGGRRRPADHAYGREQTGALPLWFTRAGQPIGYGYFQLRTPEDLWYPDGPTMGPIGARNPADALECVLAAVRWARPRAATLRMGVPGPHLALAPLLDAGFQITYVEMFVSSADQPFMDAACYVPASSTLF